MLMRTPRGVLMFLWLFQLGSHGGWAQTLASAASTGSPSIPVSPNSLDPSIANLLRDTSGGPPFNVNQTKLLDSDIALLTQSNYKLQADGTVLPANADTPVSKSEMPWLLQELTGRQKLKALLQLNVIFNQYGYKNLPDSALAEIRRICRQNWAVLPKDIRSDLRKYFTAYELDSMNQKLPALKSPTLWVLPELPRLPTTPAMPKAIFVAPTLTTPPAATTASAAPATATNPGPVAPARGYAVAQPEVQPKLQAVLPSQFPSLPLPQVMQAAARTAPTPTIAAAPSPAAAIQAPVTASAPTAVAAASAPPITAVASLPAQLAQPSANFSIQPATKPTPTTAATPSVPTQAAPAAQAQAAISVQNQVPSATVATIAASQAPPAPELGEYAEIPREAFDKYLAEAPYGHEVADLLKLISDHAPDDVRRQALGVLIRFLPQVVIDPARSGEDMRVATHKLNDDPYQVASTLIVLSRGPLVLRERKFIFGAKTFLVPGSQEFYGNRGATLPAMQAVSLQNPALYEKNISWGRLQEYSDGSERLKFSREEMAGTLLYQLLKFDAHLRRWDSDPYRTELRSRSAQFRFYAKLRQDTDQEPALSQDLRTEYAQWQGSPQDYADFVLQTLAAPKADQVLTSMSGTLEQRSAWSRRHDLSVLSEAGLALSDDAQKFLLGPAPAAPDFSQENAGVQRELQALGEGSSIATIWLAEEQRFREELHAKR